MNKTELIEEAKRQENKVGFSEISRDPDARGVLSAYGIGFLEGGYWMLEKMIDEASQIYLKELIQFNNLLVRLNPEYDNLIDVTKSYEDFKKAMKK